MAEENQNGEEKKIEWYKLKGDHDFNFQILNPEFKERFSIWDNSIKKFLFGDLPADKQTDKVKTYEDKYKFMKKAVMLAKHPDWNKSNKVNCYVIVDKIEYFLSLPYGIGKQLNDLKTKLPNPIMNYTFNLTKTGEKLQTKYTLLNLGGCEPIQPSLPPQVTEETVEPAKKVSFNFGTSKPKSVAEMTQVEKDALEQFIAQDNVFDEAQFKQIWLEQLPDSEPRIDFIYQTYKDKVSQK